MYFNTMILMIRSGIVFQNCLRGLILIDLMQNISLHLDLTFRDILNMTPLHIFLSSHFELN